MIVKRLEKNGKVKAMYSSSTVAASTYDTTTGDLTVIFNNGGVYTYPAVAKTDYTRFELAESNGSEFNTHIKKKYPSFTKEEPMAGDKMTALLAEIKQLADDTDPKVDEKVLIGCMMKLISSYVEQGNFNPTIFNELNTLMGKYTSQKTPQVVS
jgi:hypothetical protein